MSTCLGQTPVERLLGKWQFEQFEEARKSGSSVVVTKTKFAESVVFIFNKDYTLDVVYSDVKTEKYRWQFNRNFIQITSDDLNNQNSPVLGLYSLHYLDKISQLFLQRKNDPHNGIMLKV